MTFPGKPFVLALGTFVTGSAWACFAYADLPSPEPASAEACDHVLDGSTHGLSSVAFPSHRADSTLHRLTSTTHVSPSKTHYIDSSTHSPSSSVHSSVSATHCSPSITHWPDTKVTGPIEPID